jgi:hypothetical protein
MKTKGRKKAIAFSVALIVALMTPQFAFAVNDEIVTDTAQEQVNSGQDASAEGARADADSSLENPGGGGGK